MISKETKDTIEWIGGIAIEKFEIRIENLKELKTDEKIKDGTEDFLISMNENWISKIKKAVEEVKKA